VFADSFLHDRQLTVNSPYCISRSLLVEIRMAMTRSLTPARDDSDVSRSPLWMFPPVINASFFAMSFDGNLLCLHTFIWLADGRDKSHPYS
jgi:hypothetical protein